MVQKDGQDRRAEILSIKVTRSGRQFYCNFDNFNKRLDEWVPAARIRFDIDVEWPNSDKDKQRDAKIKKASTASKKTQVGKKTQKRLGKKDQTISADTTTQHPWTGKMSSP
jgi:histone acetyltransferase HTATIP